jgi:hypothetical protein
VLKDGVQLVLLTHPMTRLAPTYVDTILPPSINIYIGSTNYKKMYKPYSTEYLEKLKKSPELQQLEWYACKKDPYLWMTHWARTLDVHADEDASSMPFPDKEYIRFIVEKWIEHKVLVIPKTRQMMLSWIAVALYLWDTQFHKARLTAFQSKMADDADYLVRRVKTIWDNEPEFLKRYYT